MTTEQLLELATQQHRANDLPEARRLYGQVLAGSPKHAVALFRIGLLELQEGHAQAALSAIEQAVAQAPGEVRYQFGLGDALAALNRWKESAAAYRRVLTADPRSAEAHFALGRALRSLGDYAGAIASHQLAVQLKPEFADAFNSLGNCHQTLGDLPQAMAAYQRALELQPNNTSAMSNLASILLAMGQIDQAIALLQPAVDLEPDNAIYASNLGAALCQQRDFSSAASILRRAVDLDKTSAQAAYNLGTALQGLGQLREAAEQYRNAISLRPNYPDALNNLGSIYAELGEFKLATATYLSAIQVKPDFVDALNNLSCLLRKLGRLEEAETVIRRAMELNVQHPVLCNNLGNVLKDSGELDEAIDCFRRALELDPTDAATHSNLAYSLSFQATEAQPILEECQRFNALHAVPLQSKIVGHTNDRSPNRRLRIGYISPDFRDHCQSLFTIPLLSHHDHAAFEIVCYSSVERPDEFTRRIAGHADIWREVRPMNDAALSDLIRADRIDILVDLTMHMANARPLVFARKPAPIQIAWLAYPGTTGLTTIDYRFSDPRLDPPNFETHYTERTVRLPDSFWCYDPLTNQPEVTPLPALTRGHLTLGCLNNPCKVTDHTLRLWAPILRALPTAKLLLMVPPGPHRQHLLQRLTAHDITPQRVNFVSYRPRSDYLKTYHDIDVGLDTFPYNGHTTSLDSFWMGVPVITRVGQTSVGRGGLSQLFHLDLVELAAESDEAFTTTALALANDLPRLAALRQQLRPRLEHSPLMDAKRFAQNIEAAYRQIWQNHVAQSPP